MSVLVSCQRSCHVVLWYVHAGVKSVQVSRQYLHLMWRLEHTKGQHMFAALRVIVLPTQTYARTHHTTAPELEEAWTPAVKTLRREAVTRCAASLATLRVFALLRANSRFAHNGSLQQQTICGTPLYPNCKLTCQPLRGLRSACKTHLARREIHSERRTTGSTTPLIELWT